MRRPEAEYVMGTLLRARVEGLRAEEIRAALFDEIRRLEGLLSKYRPDSDLSRINRAAGIAPVSVGPEAYAAVEQALHFAALTDGAFDPTLGHRRRVVLDAAARSVFLPEPAMALDLGGIGKGFALDRALERVKASPGLERIFVDFGGQLLFWTARGRFAPERVVIENPRGPGEPLGAFEVRENGSVSTSSQAERPGHVVDPRSRRPAAGVESATAFAPTATEAEAWSTALFVDPALEKRLKLRAGVRGWIYRAASAASRSNDAASSPS